MSEEEIIGKLKLWMEYASINNGNSCIVNNAELQGLLDLYDKEKEKNKELEVINKMQEYRISVIDERELILKSKVEELLKEIQEEGEIVYKNFMTKKLEEDFEIDGAILQELGYIEGKLQSLLGKE